MRLEGNVRIILFPEDAMRSVEVKNEIVAAPLSPAADVNVNAFGVIVPTAGMVT